MQTLRKNLYVIAIVLCLIITTGVGICQTKEDAVAQTAWPKLTLKPDDRILILAPHPDDELLGCAGIIQKARAMGLPIHIVFLTYGDNNQWSFIIYRKHPVFFPKAMRQMGILRHNEAIASAKFLGVSPDNLTFLGYPDFGTLTIWYKHWGNKRPFLSMLTKVRAVPYFNALRPGAPYKGEEILRDLTTVIREFRPTKIFLSHPGDHNGDHRALYLFTRVALWNLASQMQPELYPYMVHYKGWPMPRGYHPQKQLEPPPLFKEQISWQEDMLNSQEVSRKEKALRKQWSQYRSTPGYLKTFVRSSELFGDFPVVKLQSNISSANLSTNSEQASEQLTDEERAFFVGFEERYAYIENDCLVISIKLSRPLGKQVGIAVYIFGYRSDIPFVQMPKLQLRFGTFMHAIYDQNRRISRSGIKIKRRMKEITIRVPLKLLGNPQRILTSANTYLGNLPLDWVSWRILELP
ncbi:MAG: PIG-L family deacetylase [Candidatus Omnitrophica bacterium]|nr:PIG-L family deacetylase [Candidatus Omnitrophota bacterium]MDD5352111.1 PIG-L family deacetylase [Candidatus Omnitrophota bacterium]MDD5549709.1 PIG-L family deacetylase [Candidatus Omnitrophota bacterium]